MESFKCGGHETTIRMSFHAFIRFLSINRLEMLDGSLFDGIYVTGRGDGLLNASLRGDGQSDLITTPT